MQRTLHRATGSGEVWDKAPRACLSAWGGLTTLSCNCLPPTLKTPKKVKS